MSGPGYDAYVEMLEAEIERRKVVEHDLRAELRILRAQLTEACNEPDESKARALWGVIAKQYVRDPGETP